MDGGAILIETDSLENNISFDQVTFSNNIATELGGVFFLSNFAKVSSFF